MARKVIDIEDLKGKAFDSAHYGKFEILNEEPRLPDSPHLRRVRIRFLNTGNEKVVQLGNALLKNVRDTGNPDVTMPRVYSNGTVQLTDYMYKTVETTQSGPAQIIYDYGYSLQGHEKQHMVRVRFLNTGSEKDVVLQSALKGKILDRSMIGTASTGFQPLQYDYNYTRKLLRDRWGRMMARCYDTKQTYYNLYGGVGVKVCPRWHSFDTYMDDLSKMYGFDQFLLRPTMYQIDKDYIQSALPLPQHIYSPDTCIWLDSYSNANILKTLRPTAFNGVMYNVKGVYALIYNAINCSIMQYGPFMDIYSAASFFMSQPCHPEIARKLPKVPMPEPCPIQFREYRTMYHLI